MVRVTMRLCKLSFIDLPIDAMEPKALNKLLGSLGGDVVEILPKESWCFEVKAWLQDPGTLPKVYNFELIRDNPGSPLCSKHPVMSSSGSLPFRIYSVVYS